MTEKLLHKNLSEVEIKDADKGILRVRFATTGVKDHDGDITMPGAFGEQEVALSPYGHSWRDGKPPIGKGRIWEEGDAALGEFQVFMDSISAKEHFHVIKEMGALQEWSYGFKITHTGELTEEMRQNGVWRVIAGVKVFEVSPVLLGAGVGTGTVSAKHAGEAANQRPSPVKLHCTHCGYFVGEAAEVMVPVGKARSAEELDTKAAPPRDVRICRSCKHQIVFLPMRLLTRTG